MSKVCFLICNSLNKIPLSWECWCLCGGIKIGFCAKSERVIGGNREVAPFFFIFACIGTGAGKKSYSDFWRKRVFFDLLFLHHFESYLTIVRLSQLEVYPGMDKLHHCASLTTVKWRQCVRFPLLDNLQNLDTTGDILGIPVSVTYSDDASKYK